MTARNVALLRGINVGTAKAISMAHLAAVFESLGLASVRTVLRSGNVVFTGSTTAEAIENAVLDATGVRSSVLVIAAADFRSIADANPLLDVATDGSKSFITFLSQPHGPLVLPDAALLDPELLVVSDRAIYQWMPEGSMQTKVPTSFWRQFDGHLTARNQNTVQKLLTVLES
jgi:uncharacterized protein (DUF1697 family)